MFFKNTSLQLLLYISIERNHHIIFLHKYWALHGSYGFIWLLKSAVMPDPAFEKGCTIGSSIGACRAVVEL